MQGKLVVLYRIFDYRVGPCLSSIYLEGCGVLNN